MALNCAGSKFVGKDVLFEFALACGDVDPETLSWLPLGAARNKSIDISSDTVDATADDSVGSFRETLTTFKTFEVAVDGVTKRDDGTTTNQYVLFEHYITDPQPYVWIRLTGPIKTVVAFCVLTSFNEAAPYDDVMTYDIAASATAREGAEESVIVSLTPVPVTGVTVSPATAIVETGNTTNLNATVQPSSAVQSVTWMSGTPAVATVDSNGIVTGVSVGTSVITATSVSDPLFSDTCTVEVVAP